MSNTGNMGMGNMGMGNMGMGNMGGNGASPGGAFFADRVHLPFVTEIPPADDGRYMKPPVGVGNFPTGNWGPEYYCWLVLTQFVRTDWDTFGEIEVLGNEPQWGCTPEEWAQVKEEWGTRLFPKWAANGWAGADASEPTGKELTNLFLAARDERSDALDEIVAQRDEFASYFLNMLSASNGYPATAKLLTVASFIAGFCAMYYKGKYQRPRPSMLSPALFPPLVVPGHASFPSGHSTQAHLMAACLKDVLLPSDTQQAKLQGFRELEKALNTLAHRIARNRELAGLHYPSDSMAGKLLAPLILTCLKKKPEELLVPLRDDREKDRLTRQLADSAEKGNQQGKTWYQRAFEAARLEWEPVRLQVLRGGR